MKKEFIPYEQALALKELGFDKLCFGYCLMSFKKDIIKEGINGCVNSALESHEVALPLYQQAFRWFRYNYWLIGEIFSQLRPSNNFMYGFKIGGSDIIFDGFQTYEEAELECLKKLIEIVKEK